MSNNFFKYIFAVVVIFIIIYTGYVIISNKSNVSNYNLDQTSTLSNIKTDLRFAISELDTINPLRTNNRNVQEVTKIIYDPLITLNENYKLEYCLAEEIARTDDLTYVIKLRNGVKWQDGSNFTADDVAYTIGLIKAGVSPIYSENVKYISDDIEVIDSVTLKLTLNRSVSFFEYNLTFPIMSKKYYNEEDFASSEKIPIGTGMFKITDFSSNVIKLEKNENYWNKVNKQPMATEININLYSSIGEAYAAFKKGEIDILSVKINNIEEYIGTLGYKKQEYKAREYEFLSFNTSNEILSDSAVRKALSLVLDKNNIVVSAEGLGSGYIASNFSLDMGNWLYTKDLNVNTDMEQAAQILNNAGWERTSHSWQKREDGHTKTLQFSLTVNSNNATRVSVAENIKNQFASFGVPVTIRYVSNDSYVEAINNNEYESILASLRVGYSPSLVTFFGENNLANYYNDEVNEIMSEINNTSDENTLYEKYNRLYDIYLDEVPYIGLYRNTKVVVYNQGLVGNITANSFNIYHNIEKWYRQ